MSTVKANVPKLDKLIHEPARLAILSALSQVDQADFNFLLAALGLSRGNLSSHMSKLEGAGYIEIKKEFGDKIPRTLLRISSEGRRALLEYTERMRQVLAGVEQGSI